MEEVFQLADRITILRDGRHVATDELANLSRDAVVQRMVGRKLADIYHYAPRALSAGALEVEGLCGPGLSGPCSFTAQSGEILGFFGTGRRGTHRVDETPCSAAPKKPRGR
jgi:L-arabinose transport system ATP-binding protein